MVLGQENGPNDPGFLKVILGILATAFIAIGVMWAFFVKIFLAVFDRNQGLREENRKLKQQLKKNGDGEEDDSH